MDAHVKLLCDRLDESLRATKGRRYFTSSDLPAERVDDLIADAEALLKEVRNGHS